MLSGENYGDAIIYGRLDYSYNSLRAPRLKAHTVVQPAALFSSEPGDPFSGTEAQTWWPTSV